MWFENPSWYPKALLNLYACCSNLHLCSLIITINTMTGNTNTAHSDGLLFLSREACSRSAGQHVFSSFSLSRKFIAMSTTTRSQTISFSTKWIVPIYSQSVSLTQNLLFFHLNVGLWRCIFPPCFPTKILCKFKCTFWLDVINPGLW